MLSLDTIFVPRWWKEFSEATGTRIPLPREYSGEMQRGRIFCSPPSIFPHGCA